MNMTRKEAERRFNGLTDDDLLEVIILRQEKSITHAAELLLDKLVPKDKNAEYNKAFLLS